MQPQNAVVIGGTGFIGELLLNELLNDDRFARVKALVRRPAGAPHPKLDAVVTDFNDMNDFKEKLGQGDCVFCCVGTTMANVKGNKKLYRAIDFEIPFHTALLAKEAGFKTFVVVSSVGADSRSKNFYLRLKGEMEHAVESTNIPSVHILRPSLLMGERKDGRLGEAIGKTLMHLFSFMLVGSLKRYRGIQGQTVAKAMINAALNTEPGTHVYFYHDIVKLSATN